MLHCEESRKTYEMMEQALRSGYAAQTDSSAIPGNSDKARTELAMLAEHDDWRVRYAAAIAMGESNSPAWLPVLEAMLIRENGRSLYSQPRVQYRNSYDDTRMAEQLIPIEVIFDQEYPYDVKEDWRCRGRVKQACLFAIAAIGQLTPLLSEMLKTYLTEPEEDSTVGAAAAMALGRAGGQDCLPSLESALIKDEWCLQTEAGKAIHLIRQRNEEVI